MPSDVLQENGHHYENGHPSSEAVALTRAMPADALAGFQQIMAKWLDLQKGQMRINERFLEAQENIFRGTLGLELLASRSNANNAGLVHTKEQPNFHRSSAQGMTVAAPAVPTNFSSREAQWPSPAEQLRSVLDTRLGPATISQAAANGVSKSNSAVERAAAMPAQRVNNPTVAEEVPPPVEQFRRDLLDAVSQRTGYPIEMLDEDVSLEAELGIDSIKTVEIFSSLTAYHTFLPGGDENEEETLSTFSRMKTLRDIVAVYEQRRVILMTGGDARSPEPNGTPRSPLAAKVEANGQHEVKSSVGRYALELAPADESKKKTFPASISS